MWHLKSKIDNQQNWAYLDNCLNKEQCNKVISLGESLLPETATTMSGSNSNIRDSKVSWILPSQESEWLFRHMTDVVNFFNDKFFRFDLDGFGEGFQFTKYEAPHGQYVPHIDKAFGKIIRKLSIVVQLSNPNDYEGGSLGIHLSEKPIFVKKTQGYCVCFPSHILHGVQPVTRGTRYSLVAWITGPEFK